MADFVDADDAAGAPADDTEAFLYYARIANEKFSSRITDFGTDEEDWQFLQEARFSFQNYIYAIGSIYGVPPFDEAPLLKLDDYGQSDWRSFKAVFDRRMATLFHSKARAVQVDGFLLTETAKEGIRKHLSGLRKYIAETELPEKTKKKLLDRVNDFEKSLNGRRMNMTAIWTFAGFVLGAFADVSTIGDSTIVNKLLSNVFLVASEEVAKTEEVAKLMAPKSPLQIPHHKHNAPAQEQPSSEPATERRKSLAADLDDEIPF